MNNSEIVELFYGIKGFNLCETYKSQFIEKVNKIFDNKEIKDFFITFHPYLYKKFFNDFIMDLDYIWKYTGVKQKVTLTRKLEKHFTLDKHYKILETPKIYEKKEKRGGHNKKTFMINVFTFNKLCATSFTQIGDDTYDKLQKLERFIEESILENTNEMKKQLGIK